MKIYVREATNEDAATIADIFAASCRTTYGDILPESLLDGLKAETLAQEWAHTIAAEDQDVYLATHNNEAVGFAHIGKNNDDDLKEEKIDVVELHALYFHPELVNQGLGSEMWGLLEESLIGKRVVVWFPEGNRGAHHFYIKQGFEQDLVNDTRELLGQSLPSVRYRKLVI